VALNAPALTPGSTIALTSSSASASVPATITVPTGAAFSWFRVTTGSVAGRTAVTLTVTYLGASKSFALTITPAAAAGGTAAFLKTDSTTIGFWKGVYGADGFELAGDSSSDPSYVTVTHSGNSSYNWSAVTTDPRALQKAASTTDRIAACWCSSTSFSIDLSFHDANVHQVAMYMLDWEPLGRAERVDILDANNNLLDTRPVTEFAWGHYLVWSLSGHVVVRVTATNASFAAAASGLFFR
jgi:hypothetical protein